MLRRSDVGPARPRFWALVAVPLRSTVSPRYGWRRVVPGVVASKFVLLLFCFTVPIAGVRQFANVFMRGKSVAVAVTAYISVAWPRLCLDEWWSRLRRPGPCDVLDHVTSPRPGVRGPMAGRMGLALMLV